MNQNMTGNICPDCGATSERERIVISGVERFKDVHHRCEPCQAELERRLKADEERKIIESRIRTWDCITPPIYRESDPFRFPQQIRDAIEKYDPETRKGLGFVGAAGSCKTRAAYTLLKPLHMQGRKVYGLASTAFAKAAAEQFDTSPISDDHSLGAPRRVCDSARKILAATKDAEFLLLDDIGKGRFTERAETEFFDLLEYRTSHALPIIWTSNAEGKQLGAMLSVDKGQPIMRRLVEFSTIVKV